MSGSAPTLEDLKADLTILKKALRNAGVPSKLISSIQTKCLRTPRRQTGRVERRTNRDPRWCVAADHPDYAPENEAHLVLMRLLLDMVRMKNAPEVDEILLQRLSGKYFRSPLHHALTADPVTDEVFDFSELENDVAHKPKHGYSRFHIGHQDPRFHPKHVHSNVRWQLKSSNDFQKTMYSRVARIAYLIDLFTQTGDPKLFRRSQEELSALPKALAHDHKIIGVDSTGSR